MSNLQFGYAIPFVDLVGLQLVRVAPHEIELALDLRPELLNSLDMAHGGVVMTLLDVAMAQAARSPSVDGGEMEPGAITVEMKTTFLRPGRGRLIALGRRLHRTTSLVFCEGSVLSEDHKLVAHGTGTFKPVRRATVEVASRTPASE